ncbi:NAD(P)-dependent oxidoreductase [Ramlibacter agri]|nr:NAD(P)-dependent oxidoreductase [Ramlibacter agri]
MRILLTGASGFIGQAVAKALAGFDAVVHGDTAAMLLAA